MVLKRSSMESQGQQYNIGEKPIVILYTNINHHVCVYGHTYRKSMNQPGKVANPARGQLNKRN